MGACCCQRGYGGSAAKPLLSDDKDSKNEDERASMREDNKWTAALRRDAERDKKIKKLLLLGPGSSGKSTFFKQLLRIHGSGLSDLKKQYFSVQQSDMKRAIYDNILDQIRAVIIQCRSFEYTLSETEEKSIKYIESLPSDCEINRDIAFHIGLIW
eukprot:301901_1